ncbi:MAG: hypothetical protein FWE04_07280 [Oscillospiraceae bacterium]|nr:hypothetical protein [Oscillospiraceae bacterium]
MTGLGRKRFNKILALMVVFSMLILVVPITTSADTYEALDEMFFGVAEEIGGNAIVEEWSPIEAFQTLGGSSERFYWRINMGAAPAPLLQWQGSGLHPAFGGVAFGSWQFETPWGEDATLMMAGSLINLTAEAINVPTSPFTYYVNVTTDVVGAANWYANAPELIIVFYRAPDPVYIVIDVPMGQPSYFMLDVWTFNGVFPGYWPLWSGRVCIDCRHEENHANDCNGFTLGTNYCSPTDIVWHNTAGTESPDVRDVFGDIGAQGFPTTGYFSYDFRIPAQPLISANEFPYGLPEFRVTVRRVPEPQTIEHVIYIPYDWTFATDGAFNYVLRGDYNPDRDQWFMQNHSDYPDLPEWNRGNASQHAVMMPMSQRPMGILVRLSELSWSDFTDNDHEYIVYFDSFELDFHGFHGPVWSLGGYVLPAYRFIIRREPRFEPLFPGAELRWGVISPWTVTRANPFDGGWTLTGSHLPGGAMGQPFYMRWESDWRHWNQSNATLANPAAMPERPRNQDVGYPIHNGWTSAWRPSLSVPTLVNATWVPPALSPTEPGSTPSTYAGINIYVRTGAFWWFEPEAPTVKDVTHNSVTLSVDMPHEAWQQRVFVRRGSMTLDGSGVMGWGTWSEANVVNGEITIDGLPVDRWFQFQVGFLPEFENYATHGPVTSKTVTVRTAPVEGAVLRYGIMAPWSPSSNLDPFAGNWTFLNLSAEHFAGHGSAYGMYLEWLEPNSHGRLGGISSVNPPELLGGGPFRPGWARETTSMSQGFYNINFRSPVGPPISDGPGSTRFIESGTSRYVRMGSFWWFHQPAPTAANITHNSVTLGGVDLPHTDWQQRIFVRYRPMLNPTTPLPHPEAPHVNVQWTNWAEWTPGTPIADLRSGSYYSFQIGFLPLATLYDTHGPIASDVLLVRTLASRTISGTVFYDGWNPLDVRPAIVRLYDSDDNVVATVNSYINRNNGGFVFTDVPPGTYSIVMHKMNHTSVTITNIVVAEANIVIPGTQFLFAGNMDAINDNEINTLDWSLLVNSMFQTHIQALEQDLNDDGEINVLDQSLLLNNFLQTSRVINLAP